LKGKSLNFPSFFQNAIKGHSSLSQIDAVNVLLCGVTKEGTIDRVLDNPTTSSYTSGKRPIRKEILIKLSFLTKEEAVRRLHILGIQDIQKVADASEALIREDTDLSDTTREYLLSREAGTEAGYDFVAKVFLSAVNGPLKPKAGSDSAAPQPQVSQEPQKPLFPTTAFSEPVKPSEDFDPPVKPDDPDTVLLGGYDWKRRFGENTEPLPYSHEAIEVSVTYRSLSMPEDKETVMSEFFSRYEGLAFTVNRKGSEAIFPATYSGEYFWAEVKGTYRSVSYALSKWSDLPFCVGALILLEGRSQALHKQKLDDIMGDISCAVQKEATIICATKYTNEVADNHICICGIFRLLKDSAKSKDTIGRSGPVKSEVGQDTSHVEIREEKEEVAKAYAELLAKEWQ